MFPGGWEWLVVLAIVILIFGAGKLPNVMGDVAKGIKNFKKGMAGDEPEAKKNIKESVTVEADPGTKGEKAEAEKKQN
jgi:sec-independent protein translocase protein TatA